MTSGVIFLSAGEPSGDLLGARLITGLRQHRGGTRFVGIGGPRMIAEGLEPLFPSDDLAVMGVTEVLPRLPRLLARIRQTVAAVRRADPAALVTIDSPDFNFRVARALASRRFPIVHYVAPSVWAWRPGRARTVARLVDHLLTLLPFEPPYFEREGLPSTFVGHPIVESGADRGDAARFRARHGLPADAPLLCLLPGSRPAEVNRLLPPFRAAAERLAGERPGLVVAVPTVGTVAARVRGMLEGWRVPARIVEGDADKYDAFAAASGALAASGTVTLELAIAGVPTVIAYRVGLVTGWIARALVETPSVGLVNVLLGRGIVPELLQGRCTPDALHGALASLLRDEHARAEQATAGRAAAAMLGAGGPPPSLRAAAAVGRAIGAGRVQPRSSSGM